MIKLMGWRKLLTFATVDAVLICTAGAASAAVTATTLPAMPALPTLLLLGVGLVGVTLQRGAVE